tara:strand:- start:18713 stop:18964 length:252 start_codon:yes stop_codon:yes gene_type:complete
MTNQEPIRFDELQAELDNLVADEDHPGWSARELQEIWSVPMNRVHAILGAAKAAGRLVVGKKRVERIDGRFSWRPCYQIRSAE